MFASDLIDEDEAPNFWCVLADLEWRYGVLKEETKNKTLEYIKKWRRCRVLGRNIF